VGVSGQSLPQDGKGNKKEAEILADNNLLNRQAICLNP
jgi:hypothetical protein